MILGTAQQQTGDGRGAPAAQPQIQDDEQVVRKGEILHKCCIAHDAKGQRPDGSYPQHDPQDARQRRQKAIQQNEQPLRHPLFRAVKEPPRHHFIDDRQPGRRQQKQQRGQKRQEIIGEFFHGETSIQNKVSSLYHTPLHFVKPVL